MRRIIKPIISFTLCLILLACSNGTLTKVINIFSSAAPLIASFQLDSATTRELTSDFADITQALKDLRDNKGTIDSVLSLLDRLSAKRISNPTAEARIQAIIGTARIILSAFNPAPVTRSAGGGVNVDQKVDELRQLMKP
jgi:hypothetical protein